MITCKEDLINTYVKNTPELRRGFLSLAVRFGLIDSKSKVGESSEDAVVACWQDVTGNNPIVGCWFTYADKVKEECRELTISDLKPTPTKFVKVEESIFDLKGEFERGELYCRDSFGDYGWIKFTDSHQLALCLNSEQVYRQVEVDWRDEMAEFTGLGKDFYTWVDCINDMYNFDFVEMCHKVAELTEKPE